MKERLTTKKFIIRAQKVHGDKYNYSKCIFTTTKNKITITCLEHGDFRQRASAHIYQKQGCIKCRNKSYTKTIDAFLKQSYITHGDKYNYSKVKYVSCSDNVTIICPEHGEFKQQPTRHKYGQGCPCCVSKQHDNDSFIKESRKKHGNRYDYSRVKYVNNKTKVTIICPIHGKFEQMAGSHLVGYGCRFCKESWGEKEIRVLLEKNNINFIPQHSYNNCRNKELLSFDFYLPDYNTCIEYNGRQHYEPVECFGGEKQFKKQIINDKIKKEYCLNNNIPLIIIKYNEDVTSKINEML